MTWAVYVRSLRLDGEEEEGGGVIFSGNQPTYPFFSFKCCKYPQFLPKILEIIMTNDNYLGLPAILATCRENFDEKDRFWQKLDGCVHFSNLNLLFPDFLTSLKLRAKKNIFAILHFCFPFQNFAYVCNCCPNFSNFDEMLPEFQHLKFCVKTFVLTWS